MGIDKLSSGRSITIEKLTESKFFYWKQKITVILPYREIDHTIFSRNKYRKENPQYFKWMQCDKPAQAIIGLSLSDDMLEHVQIASTASEMYESI